MRLLAPVLTAWLLLLSTPAPSRAFTVTLLPVSDDLRIEAGFPSEAVVDQSVTLPLADTDVATGVEGTTTTATYDWTNQAFQTDLSIALREVGGTNTVRGIVHAQAGVVFSVDQDVAYALEGVFDAGGATMDFVRQTVTFGDLTAGTTLFNGHQVSSGVDLESFTLGLAEGNDQNALEGDLSGILPAGHEFVFNYLYSVGGVGVNGADANGFVRLSLVPEPSTVVLLASGLTWMAGLRRCSAAARHRGRRPRGREPPPRPDQSTAWICSGAIAPARSWKTVLPHSGQRVEPAGVSAEQRAQ